jgi:elongation factor G
MDLEREKGITIQSAATYCQWNEFEINLIDTPGHVDFTVEVERALRVLDGAVLVLCGVSGVQSQSITVDRQMRRYNVPRLAFINKVDRSGSNPDKVIGQLREKLHHNALLMTMPMGLEDKFEGVIDLIKMNAIYYRGDNGVDVVEEPIPANYLESAKQYREKMIEGMADLDDNIAEKFLGGEEIGVDELIAAIRRATLDLKLTPVYVGTAMKNKGVQTLLDALVCSFQARMK